MDTRMIDALEECQIINDFYLVTLRGVEMEHGEIDILQEPEVIDCAELTELIRISFGFNDIYQIRSVIESIYGLTLRGFYEDYVIGEINNDDIMFDFIQLLQSTVVSENVGIRRGDKRYKVVLNLVNILFRLVLPSSNSKVMLGWGGDFDLYVGEVINEFTIP